MGKYENPKHINYNGDYAQKTDSSGNVHVYNKQGRETWQSEYDNNVRETNEANKRAADEYERIKRDQKKRQRSSQRSSTGNGSSSGIGLAGFFLGTAGLALPFIFNGILVLLLAVFGKILSPVMPLLKLILNMFWMFLTCWVRVLKIWFTGPSYDVFFKTLRIRWVFPIEMAIAVIFLIKTVIKSFGSDDFWYEDNNNLKPLIIFPILEVLHSFTTIGSYNTYGHLLSIANGLFLGAQLLIFMGWIIRFIDNIKYR